MTDVVRLVTTPILRGSHAVLTLEERPVRGGAEILTFCGSRLTLLDYRLHPVEGVLAAAVAVRCDDCRGKLAEAVA